MPSTSALADAIGLSKFTCAGSLLPADLSALAITEAIRIYDALWQSQEAIAAACCYAQACGEPLDLVEALHERMSDDAQRLAEHVRQARPLRSEHLVRGLFLIRRATDTGESIAGIAALAANLAVLKTDH